MDSLPLDGCTYSRLVRYGDCDASFNYYAPYAMHYAVEAVEAWYQAVLGVSWGDLAVRGDWQVVFNHLGCEFRKAVSSGDLVRARVAVLGVEAEQIMFRVAAEDQTGNLCFVATLTACHRERGGLQQVPLTSLFRERVEGYRARFPAAAGSPQDGAHSEAPSREIAAGPPSSATHSTSGGVPFVLSRRVTFGDCGPFGSVYAPRIFEFILDALAQWYEAIVGISWLKQNRSDRGQPFLSIDCDCAGPVVVGRIVALAVEVSRLGNSSIAYAVTGRDDEGTLCFSARIAACYVIHDNGRLRPTPFPEELRRKITAYREGA